MSGFESTRWDIVRGAGSGSLPARVALESLCRAYRPPVLAYVRSRGYSGADAEDLTQAFFAHFLESGWYIDADPRHGHFRAFLLTVLRRFLSDARSATHALKRGGGYRTESTDFDNTAAGADESTPEREFERACARMLLNTAFRRLRIEARQAGKLPLFDALSDFLVERPDRSDYARVAATLGIKPNTLAVAVRRLRLRLHELVEEELRGSSTEDAPSVHEYRLVCSALRQDGWRSPVPRRARAGRPGRKETSVC